MGKGAVRDEGEVTEPHHGEGLGWKEIKPKCEGTIGSFVVRRCVGGVRVV